MGSSITSGMSMLVYWVVFWMGSGITSGMSVLVYWVLGI